jgi:catechol 2,3-dioxygenase-like lactoylglutathione lyase family enzyme
MRDSRKHSHAAASTASSERGVAYALLPDRQVPFWVTPGVGVALPSERGGNPTMKKVRNPTSNRKSGKGDSKQVANKIDVLFIAGFGPIVQEPAESRKLYSDVLGISFKKEKEETADYFHTEALQGAKTFALWPLSQAAYSCFGNDSWPEDIPVPQAWLEFDVDNVENATASLESRGYRILIKNKREPWGQTVTRFISPEGLLVGLTVTPSVRKET